MKVLVVYDSVNGNTEQIARAIAGAFNTRHTVQVLRTGAVNPQNLQDAELLIAGSPTYGGRPTPEMLKFLSNIPEGALKNINVAAFDTRLTTPLVKLFGYAAGKIADQLKNKGGNPLSTPEGFFVKGSKGPLKEGELERASNWARDIVAAPKSRVTVK
jgi:flavodoxin I